MNLRNYRLVISDLDGTLVEYGSDRLSPGVETAVARLREQGMRFTIATGRSWKQTRPIAQALGVTVPVILQAGAIVFDPVAERVLRQIQLRPDIDEQLQDILDHDSLETANAVDQFCLDESGAYHATIIRTEGGKWLHERSGERCLLNRDYAGAVVKHFFTGPEQALKNLSVRIHQEVQPRPNMILWPPDRESYDWSLEVFDPDASKGQALQWLVSQQGLKMKQVLAFGDGFNDLDMLQGAGLGVAMKGAPDLVRAKADRVIPGPEEDGIARFLNGEIAGVCERKPLLRRLAGMVFTNQN